MLTNTMAARGRGLISRAAAAFIAAAVLLFAAVGLARAGINVADAVQDNEPCGPISMLEAAASFEAIAARINDRPLWRDERTTRADVDLLRELARCLRIDDARLRRSLR